MNMTDELATCISIFHGFGLAVA